MRMDQWCVGVGGLSRPRTLFTTAEINILAVEPTGNVMMADNHLQIDPFTVCVSSMRKVPSIIWVESRREVIADGQRNIYA